MATNLVVRNVDEDVALAVKKLAVAHGRSAEAEHREILRSALLRPKRRSVTLVKLADGAKDNWTYLSAALPPGVELIDYYHACDHLKDAFDAPYGEKSTQSKAQFEKYRYILRDETAGVENVIRALVHLKNTHPRKRARHRTDLFPAPSPPYALCRGAGHRPPYRLRRG